MNYNNDNLDMIDIKQYICRVCLELDKHDLISILNFLKNEHLNKKMFNQNNDGIKINLDALDNIIIIKLYDYIRYKLSS